MRIWSSRTCGSWGTGEKNEGEKWECRRESEGPCLCLLLWISPLSLRIDSGKYDFLIPELYTFQTNSECLACV
jgi:hypothetical protein